ncbi:hypothetical protein RMATCC62417_14131 [Rhizopus microsporus]|nr:hypothetical protein RMATCC62417_14131 [Rhizopus microsporus]
MSRSCNIGLLATEEVTDISRFIEFADTTTHDFVVAPIAKPSFRRVLNQDRTLSQEEHEAWKDQPVFDQWSGKVLGLFSDWIDLDSPSDDIRTCSEIAFKQEADWATHIGLTGTIFPTLGEQVHSTARVLNTVSRTMSPQLCVRVLLTEKDREENLGWKRWNRLRLLTGHNTRIGVALEVTAELPTSEALLNMWLAEPVRALIVPAHVFVPNQKGFPVLSKRHQNFIKMMMDKMRPDIIVTVPKDPIHPAASPASYNQYMHYLNRNLPEPNEVEKFASGYFDYLQIPLQPLADNLENHTYETFERDPIKYQQYERAVYQALLERVEYQSDVVTTIMVVGAGRGPLVNCCLRAAEKSLRKIRLIALEKNPNAYVTLQNMKAQVWGDKVDLVFADMRTWNPETKCDILVSELLGSFGDNELSPECLDGAQKFLKEGGISIPSSYTTSIAPLASTRIRNSVAAYNDLKNFETPYVVMFQQAYRLAEPEDLWTFYHPNKNIPTVPINNLHNKRDSYAQFVIDHDAVMHGLAGYFDCVLYKDVTISIHPETHSPGMFSWFPIFFPVAQPVEITKDSIVTVHFWRLTDSEKVWYEWSVVVQDKDKQEIYVSPIHNPGGRSYYVSL